MPFKKKKKKRVLRTWQHADGAWTNYNDALNSDEDKAEAVFHVEGTNYMLVAGQS